MPIRTIIALANEQPQTPEDLRDIPGIGAKTMTDHGPDLLEIIAQYRLNS